MRNKCKEYEMGGSYIGCSIGGLEHFSFGASVSQLDEAVDVGHRLKNKQITTKKESFLNIIC